MKQSARYFALVVLTALVVVGAAAARPVTNAKHTSSQVQVDFVKHVVDPTNFVFEGTVSGDVSGDLISKLVSINSQHGKVLHITFDWIVSAGPRSFTARTEGAWNLQTGGVVMDGKVIDGYLLGARVYERGQLIDPSTLTFEGYLRLMPKTA